MNPQNGIIGDAVGTELPQMQPDEDQLVREKQMARFGKTKEYQILEQHFKDRIDFYQKYLPDGRPVASVPKKDLEAMWIASNVVIGELQGVLDMYQIAREAVEDANK